RRHRFTVKDFTAGEINEDDAIGVSEIEPDSDSCFLGLRTDLRISDGLLKNPANAAVDVVGVLEHTHARLPRVSSCRITGTPQAEPVGMLTAERNRAWP